MVSQAGSGINIVFGANGVGVGAAGAMTNATPFTATLDASGQASISVPNAKQKKYVASFQSVINFQSDIKRIDTNNTSAIVLEAGVQGLAAGASIAGWYW